MRPRDQFAEGGTLGDFIGRMRDLLGADGVSTDPGLLDLMSVDFSEMAGERAAAVLRPRSTEDVVAIVTAAAQYQVPLLPRGGGMSYTLGYVPSRPGSVLLDMRGMNRILDIDLDNLVITVEPGVTWAEIHQALAPTGYRIGFEGTMSGIQATVGGGLGNNAVGHGRGVIGDHLLGLEVVLPDGRVIQTGGRATSPDCPTIRGFGPDFTGVFIHDAAAFGIRTKASFRLERRPGGIAFVCHGFKDPLDLTLALCDTERLGVTTSNMAFSRYHHGVFAGQQPDAAERRAFIAALNGAFPSRIQFARALMTLARSRNMKFLEPWPHSTLTVIEAHDQASAARAARAVRRVMRSHGGRRLNESLGIVVHAQPFVPIDKLIVGRDGECSFPSNFTVPLGRASDLVTACDAFFAANREEMERHGVTATRLFLTFKGMFGLEPILYWHDRMNPLRASVLSDANRDKWGSRPAAEERRAYALDLRRRMVATLDRLAPMHFQTGKYYDYRGALASAAEWSLVDGFKTMIDPGRIMNPGAMGLD